MRRLRRKVSRQSQNPENWFYALVCGFIVCAAFLSPQSRATVSAKNQAKTTPSCKGLIKAITIYEDEINGKIVEKHSTFEIPETWDPNSKFDLLALTTKAQKSHAESKLEVEFISPNHKIRKIWQFNSPAVSTKPSTLAVLREFKPLETLKFEVPGELRIRLVREKSKICETRLFYVLGHAGH